MAKALKGVLNICPSCNDRAKDHQSKREEGHAGHRAAKPKNLTIGNQDDGQVFEDGVDRNREKL